MTTKDRLRIYFEYKGVTNYALTQQTGIANGFLRNNGEVSVEKLSVIRQHYPDLSLLWVITGDGEMLTEGEPLAVTRKGKPKHTEAELKSFAKSIERLSAAIEKRDKEIEKLKEKLRKYSQK